MADKKNGNRRVGAGSMGREASSAESEGVSGAGAVGVDRVIRDTCRGFARAVDWQHRSQIASHHRDGGLEELGTGYKLSEDHEGLQSGMYISVSVLRAASTVAITGGYYDGYWQPRTVHRESMPLKEVTAEALGCLLMEMHDKLRGGERAHVT